MGSNKFLYGGLGVAVLVAVVYFFFLKPDTGPALTAGTDGNIALSASAQADREFLHLIEELSNIKLDPGLLQDPIFKSLEDFSVDPTPQPVGRSNPFAPVGR